MVTLVVEDGTGLADANSYASVAEADTYFENRGNAAWAALSTTNKQTALIRATDYMIQAYRPNWKGLRNTDTQALDWPREYVQRIDSTGGYGPYPSYYPDDVVPVEIKQACMELASRASTDTLAPDLEQLTIREKVGPIEVEYSEFSPQYVRFRAVDNLLAPFLMNVGATRKLMRV